MSKSRLTKEQKEQKETEKREKEREAKIKKLPVATLNDLISSDLLIKESGIKMKNGIEFRIKYRRLDCNEYNALPKEPETFDERVEYFKHLIASSCIAPKFESIEEVAKLDIGLITDMGREIDRYLFEERFL